MFEFQPLKIDSKDLEFKLKNLDLKMPAVAKKMMTAANKEVVKTAKSNFRQMFNPRNHSYQYETRYKGKVKPILSSFKYKNDKKKAFVSYIRNYSYHSVFLENGAIIRPKNKKGILTIRVNGEWRRIKHYVVITPMHFMKFAVNEYYGTNKAVQIMQAKLDQIIDDYWEKQREIQEEAEDNEQHEN